jgi:Protoglobin
MSTMPLALAERMKAFIGFSAEDAQNLVALQPLMARVGPDITRRFYAQLGDVPETAKHIEGRVDQLRKTHLAWLQSLVGGVYDEGYFESRWRIGLAHVRIGLEPYWVEGVMSFIRAAGIAAIAAELPDPHAVGRHSASYIKACDLDMLVINLSYGEDRLDRLAAFTGMKRGLIENIIKIPKK